MNRDTIAVFTRKSAGSIFKAGGSGDWVADRARAEKCKYLVCVRNAHGSRQPEDTLAHGTAFLVGRGLFIARTEADRIVIGFHEYASINVATSWQNRNPVGYHELQGWLRIDPATLDWKPFPTEQVEQPKAKPLTIAQARAGLAAGLGVSEDRIEIIIRA